ncbi:hypothetical protein AJ78_03941 [Emergomyces pasteurianus Ep9510]|uniref:Uncharacterized protein n=1 Tax=Emergomyces pasteurianus Ep9510 TaxID=1447872 RepID=A0A1J9QIY2_9EURO|nr:hypothetical protein AJ78_03941 [Emergomyces pasteurianus Ep9510]
MSDLNDTTKSVFLSSSKEWKLWYSFILQEASQIGVLQFVDLDQPDRMIDMKMPEVPTSQPDETKTRVGYVAFSMEREDDGPSVDVKDILRVLQRRLSPTLRSRQFEVRARHRDLCKAPKNQDIQKWLDVRLNR